MFLVSSVTNDSSLCCLVYSDVSQASRCFAFGVHTHTWTSKIKINTCVTYSPLDSEIIHCTKHVKYSHSPTGHNVRLGGESLLYKTVKYWCIDVYNIAQRPVLYSCYFMGLGVIKGMWTNAREKGSSHWVFCLPSSNIYWIKRAEPRVSSLSTRGNCRNLEEKKSLVIHKSLLFLFPSQCGSCEGNPQCLEDNSIALDAINFSIIGIIYG